MELANWLISKLADDEFTINHIISVSTYKKADSIGISLNV